jgi:hypothetical protein
VRHRRWKVGMEDLPARGVEVIAGRLKVAARARQLRGE